MTIKRNLQSNLFLSMNQVCSIWKINLLSSYPNTNCCQSFAISVTVGNQSFNPLRDIEKLMCTRLMCLLEKYGIKQSPVWISSQTSSFLAHCILMDKTANALDDNELVIGGFLCISVRPYITAKTETLRSQSLPLRWFDS